jgi:hypothetical protein
MIRPISLILPAKTHPEVVIACVAARDRARAEKYAKKHGIEAVHDSYQGLFRTAPSTNLGMTNLSQRCHKRPIDRLHLHPPPQFAPLRMGNPGHQSRETRPSRKTVRLQWHRSTDTIRASTRHSTQCACIIRSVPLYLPSYVADFYATHSSRPISWAREERC